MEEEGIKREESESKLGLEDAMEVLSALSLTSATVGGDYLVVMRSELRSEFCIFFLTRPLVNRSMTGKNA